MCQARQSRLDAPEALLLGVFGVLAVTVPLATAAPSVVNATGAITGSGTSYTLTITNTGDQPIMCMRFLPVAGVVITGATGPAGSNGGFGANGFGFVLNPPIAAGASATFAFTTQAPYPENAGGSLGVSADCKIDVNVRATGPAPKVVPCKCMKLRVVLDPTLLNKAPKLRPDRHNFGVGFQWFLTCSAGNGNCSASVHFLPPEILAGTLPKPKGNLRLNITRATITCGPIPCNTSTTGRFQIHMRSRAQLNRLFGRTLAYTLELRCGNTTQRVRVRVGVDQQGRLRKR